MTISKASSAVQAAVFALLSADVPLSALVDHIGDSAPEGTSVKRHLVISVVSEVPERCLQSGAGGNGRTLLVSVAAHAADTQERTGAKTVQAMDRRVTELLDNASLAIAGWTFVGCDLVSSTEQRDGQWRSVISDFEIAVEDT